MRLTDFSSVMASHGSAAETTVIIVTHNNEKEIYDCLESVVNQKPRPLEIIVVDSGSNDGTLDIVSQFEDVRIITLKDNIGYAGACNVGYQHAVGRYVVFLNSDTVVQEEWLRSLEFALAENQDCAMCQSLIVHYDNPDLVNSDGNYLSFLGFAWARNDGRASQVNCSRTPVAYPSGCSFIARREVLDRIGGFDESLFMYHEDVDIGYRAWMAGYSVLCEPHSVVRHKYKTKLSDFKFYLLERNRLIFLFKNYQTLTLLRILPLLLLAEVGVIAAAISSHMLATKMTSYLGFLGCLGYVARERRRMKSLRVRADAEIWQYLTPELPSSTAPSERAVRIAARLTKKVYNSMTTSQ